MGSGTTLKAARDLGRNAIGINLVQEYCQMADKEILTGQLILMQDRVEYAKKSTKSSAKVRRGKHSRISSETAQ